MKISIIIPVYNVELYISACLDSVFDQGFAENEFEVIVVNDGSPDDSKAIILKYEQKYPNLVFIDQENQGVSVARNRGIDVAKGEYIAFLDPDDSIYPNVLKGIIADADQKQTDMLYLGLDIFDEHGNFTKTIQNIGDDTVVSDGFTHPRRTFTGTLYRREIIGDIRYIKGIPRGQDSIFNAMVQTQAKRVGAFSAPYYKYLQRQTSSRQFVGTEKTFLGCLLAIKSIQHFQHTHFPTPSALQRAYFDEIMKTFVTRAIEWNILPNSDRTRFAMLKKTLRENNLAYLIDATAIEMKMFNHSSAVFFGYRSLRKMYAKLSAVLKK